MRAALVLIALAGCYNDTPGMRLVIRDPGFGAHHVELFIATRGGEEGKVGANQSRAQEPRVKLPGHRFFLDGPEDGITPVTRLDFTGDRVVWDLRAGDESHVDLLVAVAFDANNTAIAMAKMSDFDIPTDDTVGWLLDLETAQQMPPSDTAQPEGLRVWLWHKTDAASAACLAVEYSDGNDVQERKFLVPQDDPDCDEVELECDEYYWHADSRPVSIAPADVNCFDALLSGSTQYKTRCRAGMRTCVDGVPPGVCTPLVGPTYCVASSICNAADCLADPSACMTEVPSTVYDCPFSLDQNGGMCPDGTNGRPLHVKLALDAPNGCTSVKFTPFDVEMAGIQPSATMMVGTGTLSIEGFSGPNCEFDVFLTGTAPQAIASEPIIVAVDVTLAVDHLILPLFIGFARDGCTASANACTRHEVVGEMLEDCQ